MANRLITDIPSDIVSDGLQLWTDDIPMFGELLPSVKLLVRLPDSTKDKQYEIKYSMVLTKKIILLSWRFNFWIKVLVNLNLMKWL